MSAMRRCSTCEGFVPIACATCPNCDPASARVDATSWLRLGLLLKATAGSAVAMTLMACYGAPPHRGPVEPDVAEPATKADAKEPAKADPKTDPKTDLKADEKTPAEPAPPSPGVTPP